MSNRLVKDYLGNLIPKDKARKILGKYYVEGESCFLMEDGQWYRKTSTDKIVFDNFSNKYVLKGSTKLFNGIINEKGEEGLFSNNDFYVSARDKRTGSNTNILTGEIAIKLGYMECVGDGLFYKKSEITEKDLKEWFNKKNIPNNERSKNYNLESDLERKKELEESYSKLQLKITAAGRRISKFIGNYSFGMEAEVINGHIPRRIRSRLGLKALKDGSLKHEEGEGMEIVTMPMSGAKGVELIREFCNELSKRCEVNNYCSVHFHFGNVRKDKLYTLSMYHISSLIQSEMTKYFPYSRFNSIKADGKVYCKLLDDLSIDYKKILNSSSEEKFSLNVVEEFNKIYKWLNNGKGLAETHGKPEIVREETFVNGKKMFYDKWLSNIYSTKTIHHAVTGNKWDKPSRYYWVNFLNLYFSNIGTIEFRSMEGSTNPTKILVWLIICASILKYAEDIKRGLLIRSLTLKEILLENVGDKYTNYIMQYLDIKNKTFFESNGLYKGNWKGIEKTWFSQDSTFNFKQDNIEIK